MAKDAFDRVIEELGYLVKRVTSTVRPAPVNGAFEADGVVPDEVHHALVEAARALEAERPRDEHPGSDGRVVDVQHPSLYCYKAGVSTVLDTPQAQVRPCGGRAREPASSPHPHPTPPGHGGRRR